MTMPRFLAIFSIFLFTLIGLIALFKDKPSKKQSDTDVIPISKIEILSETVIPLHVAPEVIITEEIVQASKDLARPKELLLPTTDRIHDFFRKDAGKLPIVETVTYKSRVAWQKGRPAWLSDYARHYQTSRHFIARSLNGHADYLTQEVREGDQFNVLRKDIPFEFYLLVDASRCRMWFYYVNLETKERVLLKTYPVGLGRADNTKVSGSLTPLGKYSLGDKIMTYKPKCMGIYQGKKTEMVTIFGTRWIPFDKEIGNCSAPAKGFGIHGTPWKMQTNGELVDTKKGINHYESDGCIRLTTEDMEELFAIIVTKPTTIEIVSEYSDAGF